MSQHKPEVTVADPDHLLVDWTNAFENCESEKVQSASVEYQTFPKHGNTFSINVTFDDKKAKVEANPCLKHSVTVKIKYEGQGFDVPSHHSSYNALNADELKIKDLYSGLLQKQVVEKVCIRKDGVPSIPIIPDEISNCVNFKKISTKKISMSLNLLCMFLNDIAIKMIDDQKTIRFIRYRIKILTLRVLIHNESKVR